MEEGLNFQNVVYEACQMHFEQSIEGLSSTLLYKLRVEIIGIQY